MNSSHVDVSVVQKYAHKKSRIIDRTLDDADLESRCPLDNGRHVARSRHSAGRPGMLPLEILTNILLELDIPSLTVLRCLNHRAMDLVDSLYQYASIFKHCPDVLRAIISIHAAHSS
ncbi:hypothetical protein S40293_04477 [Stachybotrys chartarum IBT 40293]|nr:hypothetical protein S40293_04477 [Stachybotrys chartarum IBT 40293]